MRTEWVEWTGHTCTSATTHISTSPSVLFVLVRLVVALMRHRCGGVVAGTSSRDRHHVAFPFRRRRSGWRGEREG
ncbi:hypothetical protein EDB85DRAFT_1923700 [Lactarius pseudohatsudake]|nr:hypothetical protein EDB85DRAFT_1923700 [Lactarius pseudohatsudake]